MMLVDFNTFLVENIKEKVDKTTDLYLSHRFIDVLMNIKDNPISKRFLSIIDNSETGKCDLKADISFLDVTDKDDFITYTSALKANQVLVKYQSMNKLYDGIKICWITNRQELRLGRLVNRLFKDEFKQKEVTDFVNEFRAEVEKDNFFDKFKLVKGADIKKYYLYKNNSDEANGTLQHSCMKYPESQKYLDFYVENSDVMNMLILTSPDGKIYGRANVWHLKEPAGRIFMDRIYTTYEWQNKLFIDYAIKNNWIYKSKQIYGGSVIPVIINGKKEKIVMSCDLKALNYKYYPYVDTLQFYNPTTGELTSDVKKFENEGYLTLVLPNGQTYQDNARSYKIDYLGRIVHSNYVRWSNIDNVYIHVEDAIALNYRGEYVTPEHEFVVINGSVCLLEDTEIDSNGERRLKNKINI